MRFDNSHAQNNYAADDSPSLTNMSLYVTLHMLQYSEDSPLTLRGKLSHQGKQGPHEILVSLKLHLLV